MLMRYHWGLGVGHAYAHSTTRSTDETQSVSDFSGEATSNVQPIIGDDSDDYSSLGSPPSDLDELNPNDSDDETAAMYDRNSQDEDEDQYRF